MPLKVLWRDEVNLYFANVTINFECLMRTGGWTPIYQRPNDVVSPLHLFAVFAQPGTPMATPWVGVLEDSCFWAQGKSTAADVAEKLTTGFYFSQKAIYDSSDNYWTWPSNLYTFLLTDFLNNTDRAKQSIKGLRKMDCRDVSHYLCIAANSQGLGFTVSPYVSTPDKYPDPPLPAYPDYRSFDTNRICPMDHNPALDINYQAVTFTFHQLAHSGTGTVYDATNAQLYDLSGNGFRNPPFNWPLSSTSTSGGYWQTAIPAGTSLWNPVGLVALPNPSTVTAHPILSGGYAPFVR